MTPEQIEQFIKDKQQIVGETILAPQFVLRAEDVRALLAQVLPDGYVAVGFRYRMKGCDQDWYYNYHRDPDSFELRECDIETVFAGKQPIPVSEPKCAECGDNPNLRSNETATGECPACASPKDSADELRVKALNDLIDDAYVELYSAPPQPVAQESEQDDGWFCDYCEKEVPDSAPTFRFDDDHAFCTEKCCDDYQAQL